jgi:hypothetical protein
MDGWTDIHDGIKEKVFFLNCNKFSQRGIILHLRGSKEEWKGGRRQGVQMQKNCLAINHNWVKRLMELCTSVAGLHP